MNKISLYSIFACLVLVFTACDDFLDVQPPTAFDPDYVFSSPEQVRSAVDGIYSLMIRDDTYRSRIPYNLNTNTDVEISGVSSEAVSVNGGDIACYDPKPYWVTLNNTWVAMYKLINQANDVVEGIENSEIFEVADKTKASTITQLYGEAKTLRAMAYLDLIRLWGDVVFRMHSANASEDLIVPVTDRTVILDSLINDLIRVEPMMHYAVDLDYGVERASREFCQGLIGLLAMNRGGWFLRPDKSNPAAVGTMERGDNHEYYYDLAIEYLGYVIDEGRHDLNLSFEAFWDEQCKGNSPVADDIIFSIPYRYGQGGVFGYDVGQPIDEGTHEYGPASGNLSLTPLYYFSFDTLDLRRDITCVPYKYNDVLNQEIRFAVAQLATGKWNKLKMDKPLGPTVQRGTGMNFVYMRFAEVLLLYAEAVNERFGPREDAKEALKRVRKRAFDTTLWGEKVEAYVERLGSKDDFFQAIMDERAWEFGGESKRKHDLARWNKYSETIYNLYYTYIDWANAANGEYNDYYFVVRPYIYYKSVEDPEHPDRTILELDGVNRKVIQMPEGFTAHAVAVNWTSLNSETQLIEPVNAIKWSFRKYINFDNAATVSPNDPLRYLVPYPTKVITDHRGQIQNYYGFNY